MATPRMGHTVSAITYNNETYLALIGGFAGNGTITCLFQGLGDLLSMAAIQIAAVNNASYLPVHLPDPHVRVALHTASVVHSRYVVLVGGVQEGRRCSSSNPVQILDLQAEPFEWRRLDLAGGPAPM